MKGKNDDLPLEVVPKKEVIKMENEEKKGVNSNIEKSVCDCSNNYKERNKEEEHGKEEKVQKFELEDQKVGPIIQGKVDESSNDDALASSNNKENEEDFNEAWDFGATILHQISQVTLEEVLLDTNLRIPLRLAGHKDDRA
ncbi:hypothetical protein SUGI_0754430 [Cryptomeria japonica]|nr:hypothetical protein SUGI_0754430 [Cryptomeria japonica]